jgi:hypothetical protein
LRDAQQAFRAFQVVELCRQSRRARLD